MLWGDRVRALVRRVLMRRAYNAGHYEQARHHANRLLDVQKQQNLARSIVLRSYWNQQAYGLLVATGQHWADEASVRLVAKASERLDTLGRDPTHLRRRQERWAEKIAEQPRPNAAMTWDGACMRDNFLQEGSRVWFRFRQGHVFWDMPEGYDLSAAHPSLLELVAELLVVPWEPQTRAPFSSHRSPGTRPALAFSGGVDSTAAALVMPENTLLGYHRRSFSSMLDHRNADRLLSHLVDHEEREVVQVTSNHELIRAHHGKMVGFSSDLACAAHLILLADHDDLGAIGFGMPIDNTYLAKGAKFRPFASSTYFTYWTERFANAGLDLLLPVSSLTEGGALNIVKQSPWLEHINSCMRGDGTAGCGQCWKCFHKNGPLGRPFDIHASGIQHFLCQRPMPTATHALWALQSMGLEEEVPELLPLLKQDLGWWTGVYPPGFDLLPERWRAPIEARVRALLPLMPEPYALHDIDLFPDE